VAAATSAEVALRPSGVVRAAAAWISSAVRPGAGLPVIGLWAGFQFVVGAGSLLAPSEGGGVAYLAHVGGFVAGLVLIQLFRSRRRGPGEAPFERS